MPHVAAQLQRSVGRSRQLLVRRTWQPGSGGPEVQTADRFDSDQGRALITTAAQQLGLKQRRSGAEKIGLAVGIVCGAGALLTGLAVLLAWLLGRF